MPTFVEFAGEGGNQPPWYNFCHSYRLPRRIQSCSTKQVNCSLRPSDTYQVIVHVNDLSELGN